MSVRLRSLARTGAALLAFALIFASAAAAAAGSPSPAPAAAALGTQSYADAPGVQVTLLSLARTDGSITARWSYRNTTSGPLDIGTSFTGKGFSEPYSLSYYAYLLAGTTKYPVLKDEKSHPYAGTHPGHKVVTLGAGETYETWAKFPDPGASTTAVTVVIPGAAPFENVPIS
jgi:hypothetical protein